MLLVLLLLLLRLLLLLLLLLLLIFGNINILLDTGSNFLGICSLKGPTSPNGNLIIFKQYTMVHDELAKAEGRVYFAGEHTDAPHGWIDTAIKSGVRAAAELHTGKDFTRYRGIVYNQYDAAASAAGEAGQHGQAENGTVKVLA